MGYKTISLSDEAYKRLLERKKGNESFSDVVLRLTGNKTLRDFVGILTEDSCSKLEVALAKFRETRGTIFKQELDRLTD